MSRPNYNFPSPNLVLLDAGHGGLDAQLNYTTPPVMGKRFDHKDKSLNFHGIAGNSVFYEGVSNRFFARALSQKLMQLGVPVLPVYHDHLDTTLDNRTTLANVYDRAHQKTVLVSLHSNAASAGSLAEGWEIYTSVGTTQSDALAANIAKFTHGTLKKYGRKVRGGRGGLREKNFHMLVKSAMPAVLIETLFFDNLQEAKLLDNPTFVEDMAAAYANGILAFLQERG
jgi:N-acetylmuramoyl-L-alanine amidase